MELLLHYVWQHRLFPLGELKTTNGEVVEIIDPGLHNLNAGPDFFNAKIKLDGQLWMGNVEIHERSSDWYRHHHETDPAYNNVILHVIQLQDCAVETENHLRLPQLELTVPRYVEENYRELLAEEAYPPCYRVIPQLPKLMIHSWMSALTVERLMIKTERIENWLSLTQNNWEQTFFITLARAFGFGTNADAFERWALRINPEHIGKHRDNPFQVEAFFLGQAGLLDDPRLLPLANEYKFLQAKFGLEPLPRKTWKFGRMRPQNAPQVRLSELANLFSSYGLNFSKVRTMKDVMDIRNLLKTRTLSCSEEEYSLSDSSIDLLLINAIAPILFAYGKHHQDEEMTNRAFELLEHIKPEHNFITRSWALAGIKSEHAADSQALIELKNKYCDKKDCLRCRFGAVYLKKQN